jgi:hypothetical protein
MQVGVETQYDHLYLYITRLRSIRRVSLLSFVPTNDRRPAAALLPWERPWENPRDAHYPVPPVYRNVMEKTTLPRYRMVFCGLPALSCCAPPVLPSNGVWGQRRSTSLSSSSKARVTLVLLLVFRTCMQITSRWPPVLAQVYFEHSIGAGLPKRSFQLGLGNYAMAYTVC